jgi:hypothetical protein
VAWIWPKPPLLGWLNWPCRLSGRAGLCVAGAEKQVGCFVLSCWAVVAEEENGGREAARSVQHATAAGAAPHAGAAARRNRAALEWLGPAARCEC